MNKNLYYFVIITEEYFLGHKILNWQLFSFPILQNYCFFFFLVFIAFAEKSYYSYHCSFLLWIHLRFSLSLISQDKWTNMCSFLYPTWDWLFESVGWCLINFENCWPFILKYFFCTIISSASGTPITCARKFYIILQISSSLSFPCFLVLFCLLCFFYLQAHRSWPLLSPFWS